MTTEEQAYHIPEAERIVESFDLGFTKLKIKKFSFDDSSDTAQMDFLFSQKIGNGVLYISISVTKGEYYACITVKGKDSYIPTNVLYENKNSSAVLGKGPFNMLYALEEKI